MCDLLLMSYEFRVKIAFQTKNKKQKQNKTKKCSYIVHTLIY